MNIKLLLFLDFADDHQLLTLLVASFQQERTAAVIVLYKAKQRSEKTLDRFLSFPLVSHPLHIALLLSKKKFFDSELEASMWSLGHINKLCLV